jgi:hypothetical protein
MKMAKITKKPRLSWARSLKANLMVPVDLGTGVELAKDSSHIILI